jgi:spore photoproduct lyase
MGVKSRIREQPELIDRIYIEERCRDHPRTRGICDRFPRAERVYCDSYREVFNPAAQNFRLQKRRPALILAVKPDGFVTPTPSGYGIGGDRNYYFSHMLNCIYDCRYCFLQGMYRSAHYVVFVNFEDFEGAIRKQTRRDHGHEPWFFSGYDCDSLALEPVTGFMGRMLALFEGLPAARLELRTKSTQIRSLADRPAMANVVVAFSLTPEEVSRRLEHRVPALGRRIAALGELAARGWRVGLRFDPLICEPGFEAHYDELFAAVFTAIDPAVVHSVTLGAFRMPKEFHARVERLYPDEPLYAMPMSERQGVLCYPRDVESRMLRYCRDRLRDYVPAWKIYGHEVHSRQDGVCAQAAAREVVSAGA